MTRRERLQNRADRRREWAESRRLKAEQAFSRAESIASLRPLGQPILLNHHSTKRALADQSKIENSMRAGCESSSMAIHHENKADGIENQLARSVFSDDEDAIEQLTAKIEQAEALQAAMKAANAIIRKAPKYKSTPEKIAALVAAGFTEARAAGLFGADFAGRVGFADYQLSNNNANIRRMKQRVEAITATNTRKAEAAESEHGVTVEGDIYVRVTFAEKPDRSVLDSLKAHGFSWRSPSWVGKREEIPDCVRDLAGMGPPAVATQTIPTWEACITIMRDDFTNGRKRLQEISEYQFDQMLGAVPPTRQQSGCYVCGEAFTWSAEGTVYYCGFDIGNSRFAMALMTLIEFEDEVSTGRQKAALLSA